MSKKIDKEELIAAVNRCSELNGKQKEDLRQILSEQKKYGLVWEDTPENAYEELRSEIPVMREDKDKAVINDNSSNAGAVSCADTQKCPNHIIIEGDNLDALTNLCYTHAGKVDVIYIDPPYNTGARNWKYNNSFVDSEDSYRHSKWLSWISRRLRIARRLLKSTGIIIVTIDDYEYAQLKMLMDSVFQESNYLATVVIKNNPSGRSTVRGFSVNHEYALFYSKTEESKIGHMSHNQEQKSRYSERDDVGFFEWENFRKNGTDSDRKDRPKQFFPIIININSNCLRIPQLTWNESEREYNFTDDVQIDELVLWPTNSEGIEKVWKYGLERTRLILKDLLVKKKGNRYEIYRKKYLNKEGSLPRTWWDKAEYSARDSGTRELAKIFGPVKVFDFPKAPEAVKDCLRAANLYGNKIVLDFFAGSGTTLQATMELNREDCGHRQCILVTNNENGICENVTYPRNKKVIEGYVTPKGEHVEGLHDNNLRYFKMAKVPRKPTVQNRELLAASMVDMLRIKHNVYTQKDHVGSLATNPPTTRYYEDGGHGLLILMDSTRIGAMVEAIKEMPQPMKIEVYVYSDGSYAYDDDFAPVADKVNVYALPSPFIQTFNRIAPDWVKG